VSLRLIVNAVPFCRKGFSCCRKVSHLRNGLSIATGIYQSCCTEVAGSGEILLSKQDVPKSQAAPMDTGADILRMKLGRQSFRLRLCCCRADEGDAHRIQTVMG
jgi:hypothetical protein